MEKAKKRLTIDLQGSKDTYSFDGPWTGNDIRIIMTHLPKQYKLYMRTLRRASIGKYQSKGETITVKENVALTKGGY
jgi:hypothetical protein